MAGVVGSDTVILLPAGALSGGGRPSSMATATEWMSAGGVVTDSPSGIETDPVRDAGLLATGGSAAVILSLLSLVFVKLRVGGVEGSGGR